MPGTSIGIQMNLGYPGAYARNGKCVISCRQVKSTDAAGPAFGNGVFLNSDNTYSDIATAIAAGSSALLTAATFAGVAVREVKTMTTYPPTNNIGGYLPGQAADVIGEGNVSVVCQVGTPVAGGAVYMRKALNTGTYPNAVVGGFEYGTSGDASNVVLLTNCAWATGAIDGNKVAELSILNRNNP